MKKITLLDKEGKNRVYIVNNKTQLNRALPYRNPKIVKEEPLPDTIKPAKDQKLYIITGWTNSTELDDFLAAVQRRGYPVSIKTRPMHTEYGFLISDKGLKDLEAKVNYPAAYKEYQIDQDSYPIAWNNLSWYYEDDWNKWHNNLNTTVKEMKHYTIKNYKGNLLESAKKFQESHKDVRIVEALEQDDMLAIAAEPLPPPGEQHIPEQVTDPIFDFGCKLMLFGVKVHLWHLNTSNNAAHLALKELYEACDDTADKLLEAQIGIVGKSIDHFDFDIREADLNYPCGGEAIEEIKVARDEAARLETGGNRGLDSIIDAFCETCNSVIYKLTRLS